MFKTTDDHNSSVFIELYKISKSKNPFKLSEIDVNALKSGHISLITLLYMLYLSTFRIIIIIFNKRTTCSLVSIRFRLDPIL